ncbi:hypothetical protein [Deinococcus sp. Arct2-2]|uniref:hypothetical protein n=1 Tax=Deinococcus sp. Arct2-2 TaxID=2568653 RepID=UPI001454D6F4|nr:hypothetical protein [Deinococcus sp. Arct2-2]
MILAAPQYISSFPTENDSRWKVRRVESGQTIWEYILSPDLAQNSAQLALDGLFLTVCPTNSIIATNQCEVLRLDPFTGKMQTSYTGQLWKATKDYALIFNDSSKTFAALDYFRFDAQVILRAKVMTASGSLSSRQKCGGFDVLGARFDEGVVSLTWRDVCGLGQTSFTAK